MLPILSLHVLFFLLAPKVICEKTYLAYQRNLYIKPSSYINCINDGIIKIQKATLHPSTPAICPLQYANYSSSFTCLNGINQWDVTTFMKELWVLI